VGFARRLRLRFAGGGGGGDPTHPSHPTIRAHLRNASLTTLRKRCCKIQKIQPLSHRENVSAALWGVTRTPQALSHEPTN
jgi:hypothetical protein